MNLVFSAYLSPFEHCYFTRTYMSFVREGPEKVHDGGRFAETTGHRSWPERYGPTVSVSSCSDSASAVEMIRDAFTSNAPANFRMLP